MYTNTFKQVIDDIKFKRKLYLIGSLHFTNVIRKLLNFNFDDMYLAYKNKIEWKLDAFNIEEKEQYSLVVRQHIPYDVDETVVDMFGMQTITLCFKIKIGDNIYNSVPNELLDDIVRLIIHQSGTTCKNFNSVPEDKFNGYNYSFDVGGNLIDAN